MMKLLTLTAAVLAALSGQTAAQAADTAPSKPGNLTAKLYSGAGGEIFWQRSTDDRGVRGYEITKNGQSLDVRDVLSFYDASLKSGEPYTFVVTAIDTAGQRSAAATVSLGNGNTSNPFEPASGAPAAPAGLSVKRYSASTGELFWTRPATAGLRYEVSRDGAVVKTTNGVSYYDTSLPAASRDVAYAVIAIDTTGKRSTASNVVLSANGSSAGTPTNPSTAGSTSSPTGARLSVYSSTAAELFWTRPAASNGVTSTEVLRDGQRIGSTPGNSYFDATRAVGKTYRYELIAISSRGRSAPTVVSESGSSNPPTTPTAPTTPTTPTTPTLPSLPVTDDAMVTNWLTSVGTGSPLSVDNSRNFLPSLIQFINAEPARLVNERFYHVYKEAQEAVDGSGTSRFVAESTSAEATTFNCPQGGTYTLGAITGYSGASTDRQHDFKQCRIDDESFDGRLYTYRVSFEDPENPQLISVPGVSQMPLQYINKAGVSFTLDGFYDDTNSTVLDRFYWDGKIEIRKGNQSLIFEDLTAIAEYKTPQTDFNTSAPYKILRGDFTVSGTITNGRTLQFESLGPMRTLENQDVYNRGLFVVKDVSGGQLSMTALPVKPDGFTVRVDTSGRIDQYFVPWADGYEFLILPTPSGW